MKAFWASTAAANILYHDLPGSGSPVVFIHGLGCASSCDYLGMVFGTVFTGRRAILVDLLGSGFSERPVEFSCSVDAHAHSVAELVQYVCPSSICIFGNSMGGAVAIALATILGPRVEKLVLSEPNLDPGGGPFSRKIAAIPEAEYVAYGHDRIVKAAAAEGNVVWAASMAISAAFAIHRGASSLTAGREPTWRELLYGLKIPRTILFGEHSLLDTEFDRLPRHGVSVDIVPAAGHSMALQNPAGLAAALVRALG
ncbi:MULTISPECIES: alpha/beta hydrolase [unclassified Bradyrhizobium]|uniref:alpha/beta fold hydrolase n=1 Tax=unclassified Bradyrhizobium TaxID=2631580 RepID=UPI002916A790|nr:MULTISPECIES: alpha/beta hydrolase [unclassified Bradyrhizobium]